MSESPIVVKTDGGYGTILQIVLYFISFLAIIYVLYKLFGMFKDWGKKIEEKLKEVGEVVNPSDLPEKAKGTAEDIATIVEGVLTGKTNTPEYNTAKTNLQYGGAEWEPGNAKVDKEGNIHKYGTTIKPGKSKTFAGGTYIEEVHSNLVKCPYAGNQLLTKEECLARKYWFSDYANFSAWLQGVKYRLKIEGKDPSNMSLDQIVAWGRKFDAEKRKHSDSKPTLGRHEPDECHIPADKAAKMSDEELRALYEKCKRKSQSQVVPSYKTNQELGELYGKRWEAVARKYQNPVNGGGRSFRPVAVVR